VALARRQTDSGAASLSTANAGFAGVGGGLSLSTGIATDGDSGAVVILSRFLARAQSHSRLG
jgi:hypothetical protein